MQFVHIAELQLGNEWYYVLQICVGALLNYLLSNETIIRVNPPKENNLRVVRPLQLSQLHSNFSNSKLQPQSSFTLHCQLRVHRG